MLTEGLWFGYDQRERVTSIYLYIRTLISKVSFKNHPLPMAYRFLERLPTDAGERAGRLLQPVKADKPTHFTWSQ